MRWLLALILIFPLVSGHGVAEEDAGFLQDNDGFAFAPFLYLGAKHMVTGYDHLLFLVGVIFFLYKARDVGIYVSMFTLGHSVTLLIGVLADVPANAFLIDAIIGLSVAYKGFDNMGGFSRLKWQPNQKAAVLIFGLFHGFGLATKVQDLGLSKNGLFGNLIAFNLGVEIGQVLALGGILILISYWRRHSSYLRGALYTNTFLIAAGFVLFGYQLTGYFA